MSAEAILDALAVKVDAITGIKRAYGSGAGSSAVATLPPDIADGPVALVMYDGFTLEIRGSYERVAHRFVVRIYVNGSDVGYAYKTLMPFPSLFITAFRTDVDMGGTCQEAAITGGDAPVPEEVNGKPMLVLPIRVTAWEATGVGAYTA